MKYLKYIITTLFLFIGFIGFSQNVGVEFTGEFLINGQLDIQGIQTNDNSNLVISQAKLLTTDATVTTLQTIPIVADRAYIIETMVVGRRTGGTAGTADDIKCQGFRSLYATKSAVLAEVGSQDILFNEGDAGASAWDMDLEVLGSDVIVQVTGAVDVNISWVCNTTVTYIGL